MDLLRQRIKIARLIAEELTETIDEEAKAELAHWIAEDERHREEYEQIKGMLESGEQVWAEQKEGRLLTDARWKGMKQRIKKKHYITWSRYAAVLVLPLMIGLFWFMNRGVVQDKELEKIVEIIPGVGKAQLKLANGRVVHLDDSVRFQIEEIGGTEISTSERMIRYRGKDTLGTTITEERYNTLIIPRGGEYTLELVDGTRVWLNAESTLKYPVKFVSGERRVEMTGEGYFEVAKNKEKPFIVIVNGVDVRVLGTSFNVSAYRNEVITTLVEGKVQLKKGEDSVVLQPNQQGIWLSENRGFEVKEVEARNFSLWREGIFYFDDVDLETILDDMARWYNVNIFYRNPTLKTKRFSVEIKRYENINEILRRIEQTKRVKFEIKDRTINVYE